MTTAQKRELTIVKKPAYVWRVHSLGMDATHNHIPCWYVVDKNTNEIIRGGYEFGNNVQSGRAHIPRKKDAKAFIDGYYAERDSKNPHEEMVHGWEQCGRLKFRTIKPALKGADAETAAHWEDGNTYQERKRYRSISEE